MILMINGVPIGKIEFAHRKRESKDIFNIKNYEQRTVNSLQQNQENPINVQTKDDEDFER